MNGRNVELKTSTDELLVAADAADELLVAPEAVCATAVETPLTAKNKKANAPILKSQVMTPHRSRLLRIISAVDGNAVYSVKVG